MKERNGKDIDHERLERERLFHNQRYADDTMRQNCVGRFYEASEAFFAKYRERILRGADGARVLEYGVGTSSDAFVLAEHGALVTGIDISETAVTVAERESISRGLRIDFQVMNAEKTAFEDQTFDIICGTGILHHLDLRKAIPEIRRLLRRGGFAVFVEPMGHNPLINIFRRMTPRIRSADEHPLLDHDLRFVGSFFGSCRTEYFGLASLATSVARPLRRNSNLRRFLEALDRRLFAFPLLRRQAWLVLIELGDKKEVQPRTDVSATT
jgi:SAM-dependent methyltransferase